ncbi:MAG TPA: 6-phosphogluconolactonase [Solirubrobacteraceae bacterium]|jgi:6-phosphogluconolactonase
MNIEVLDDPAEAVAELLVQAEGDIVVTGGSSPQRAYELAAERRADWSGVTVWFTDERCVPPDRDLSNFAMVDKALFSRVERPPRVMRMEGELGPEQGAAAYASALGENPRFDLVLLGLGPDAHTASLFPNRPEKHVEDRLVVGVPEAGMEPFVPRISLTLPAINAARRKVFLVTGESKVEAVPRAFGDAPDPESPAAHVRPVTVFLDPAAAGR